MSLSSSNKKFGSVFCAYSKEALRHPWLLGGIIVGALGVQIGDLVAPLYLRELFNILAARTPDPAIARQLFILVSIIGTISFVRWIFRRLLDGSNNHLDSRVMANLYISSFEYLLKHSYRFFVSRFSGTLTRRVSKFAAAFEIMADGIMTQFFPTAFFSIGAVTILFLYNKLLGLALGLWLILFLSFLFYMGRRRRPLRSARADADSKMIGSLADAISNQNTIALFSGNTHERSIFGNVVEHWRRATMRSWNMDESIWSVLGFLMVSINVGLLAGAVALWKQGLVTVGDFVLIQSYCISLFERLITINRELRRFFDAHADATEMIEILHTPHEIQDRPGARALAVTHGEISFNNVDFFFYANHPVLKNFNLTIRAGEKLALVGPSGAGKSTVTKLLLRLYDVSIGRIIIDEQDIAVISQDSLRNAIAFVPQEPILFHRTLMENIRYGRKEASDTEVMDAARKAHCHEFIAKLPEQYQTFVGERGVKLSGGERQRVAIARAILKNAPILLLDEATSSLDSESEALIQDALTTLMGGKTALVIAHRLSTIMKMDRIVVLEHGSVVAEGTHRELLTRGGLYQKLWSIQAGGFREEVGEETFSEESDTLLSREFTSESKEDKII